MCALASTSSWSTPSHLDLLNSEALPLAQGLARRQDEAFSPGIIRTSDRHFTHKLLCLGTHHERHAVQFFDQVRVPDLVHGQRQQRVTTPAGTDLDANGPLASPL